MITFWLIILLAALAWYTLITLFVAVKGAKDVRRMFSEVPDQEK